MYDPFKKNQNQGAKEGNILVPKFVYGKLQPRFWQHLGDRYHETGVLTETIFQ